MRFLTDTETSDHDSSVGRPTAGGKSPLSRFRSIRTRCAGRRREPARQLSAAGVCRRGPQAQAAAGEGRRRARPSCCRAATAPKALPSIRPRPHPRFLPRLPADGGGADLRGRIAGGQGRPHRRPVRQAALVRHRDASMASRCRATAATSSTTSPSRRSRAFPIRAGCPGLSGNRRRRSTCCAPSRPAAMPTSTTRIAGCWAS